MSNNTCAGTKINGTRCLRTVKGGKSSTCQWHTRAQTQRSPSPPREKRVRADEHEDDRRERLDALRRERKWLYDFMAAQPVVTPLALPAVEKWTTIVPDTGTSAAMTEAELALDRALALGPDDYADSSDGAAQPIDNCADHESDCIAQ